MTMKFLIVSVLYIGFCISVNDANPHNIFKYCYLSCGKEHTMCKYMNEPAAECGKVSDQKLTIKEQEEIVNFHNYVRYLIASGKETEGAEGPLPAAKHMPMLQWDPELAAIAQKWALQCQAGHDKCRVTLSDTSVGQNFAAVDAFENVTQLMNIWYCERANLTRDQIKHFSQVLTPGKRIGNYTQMVWAETTKIGCGIIRFHVTQNRSQKPKTSLYCNYGPSGNYVGASVYEF